MSLFLIYKKIIETDKRLTRDLVRRGNQIDLAYAMGRLGDAEYTALVAELTSTSEMGAE